MITVVIPFNADDASRVDRLCDLCFWLGGRNPCGQALLVCDTSIHPEFKIKARLSAEVAFRSVDVMELGVPADKTKPEQINLVFKKAAQYVRDCYREPWLWLEADCVPLRPTWQADLTVAYESQARKYFGRHMRSRDMVFMNRVGIYPADAFNDLAVDCDGTAPFERQAQILPRTTNSALLHNEKYAPGMTLPDACILNGDRTGELVEQLIEKASTQVVQPVPVVAKRGPGRPRKIR